MAKRYYSSCREWSYNSKKICKLSVIPINMADNLLWFIYLLWIFFAWVIFVIFATNVSNMIVVAIAFKVRHAIQNPLLNFFTSILFPTPSAYVIDCSMQVLCKIIRNHYYFAFNPNCSTNRIVFHIWRTEWKYHLPT